MKNEDPLEKLRRSLTTDQGLLLGSKTVFKSLQCLCQDFRQGRITIRNDYKVLFEPECPCNLQVGEFTDFVQTFSSS
jgi:hypothetical protein